MKIIFKVLLPIFLLTILGACTNKTSYSQLQDQEIATINNYILQNNIQVVTTMPKDSVWGADIYYKSTSGLYFHLENRGDTTTAVELNSSVGYRFIEYNLDAAKSVRIKNWEPWDFPEPMVITYGSSTAITSIGTGIYEALGLMKYKYSMAKIIVPASLNTSTYTQNVTPVGYDLKITVLN
ncbi:MAG: DUF4827 family protein [Paludibacteraceae bacterium]